MTFLNKKRIRFCLAVGVAGAIAALTACGGGGGGSTAVSPSATPSTPGTSGTSPTAIVSPIAVTSPNYTLTTPPVSNYAVGGAQFSMFNSLNQVRIGGGFGAFVQDLLLDIAAKSHADYVGINYFPNGVQSADYATLLSDGTPTGHTEVVGNPSFTGIRPANRVAATGYQTVAAVTEVQGALFGTKPKVEPDMTMCLSQLLNTVFHRASLLSTSLQDVAIGIGNPMSDVNGYILRPCVITMASKQAATVLAPGWIGIYPFDQQQNVAVTMSLETPDPVPSSPIKGMPVSIQVAGSQTLAVQSFVLRDGAGAVVTSKVLTRNETIYLHSNEAYLVPLDTLKAGNTYTAAFAGTSNGLLVNKTWTFKT